MKQSQAFHKGIRRVWSRLTAGSGTSRPAYIGATTRVSEEPLYMLVCVLHIFCCRFSDGKV